MGVDPLGISRPARHRMEQRCRVLRRAARALAVMGCIAMSVVSNASAQDETDLSRTEVAQTVGLYDAAAADAQPGGDATSAVSNPAVEVPDDPADGVAIGVGDDAIRVIPEEQIAGADEIALPDGTSIYPGASPEIRTLVDPVAGGAQIATVTLHGSGDRQTYRYHLALPDGARLVTAPDGGASVIASDGTILADVDAPWAQGADGQALATAYEIDDDTLIQTVDTSDAVYPIVADPRVEAHWYWFGAFKFWLTRHETESVYRSQQYADYASGTTALLCGFIPIPGGAILCGFIVLQKYADFKINIAQAHQRNHCLTVYVRPPAYMNFDDGDDPKYCQH